METHFLFAFRGPLAELLVNLAEPFFLWNDHASCLCFISAGYPLLFKFFLSSLIISTSKENICLPENFIDRLIDMNFIFLKTWVYYSIIYDAGTIINVFMVISKKDFWCVDRVNIYFYVRILNVKFVPYVIFNLAEKTLCL